MSSLNLDKLELSFDPSLGQRPRRGKRYVSLIDERGMILGGIVVYYHAGTSGPIEIPEALTVLNRPEYGETTFPISDLDREALRNLVRDKLRYRPEPNQPPERNTPGEPGRLLRKARAARSGRRN